MLPKLVTPKYDMIIPSTGETVTYRPYVVKEEKILLIAMESQNESAIETAVSDIIKACVDTPISIDTMTNFDVEFMFITLRSKSVGEGVKINFICSECDEDNEHKIDLDKVVVKNLNDAPDKHVKLTDDISLDLRWATMKDRLSEKERVTGTDAIINMIAKSIDTIYSGEEIHAAKDSKMAELVEFVESLSTDQFTDIVDVISEAPRLNYNTKFSCKACKHENTVDLIGLSDFFQ
jgi:hypothetical protein|tara:strand:+ start:870 stop:1574 length:705 start_codon:yes stop_codon:yes gene_type:complete